MPAQPPGATLVGVSAKRCFLLAVAAGATLLAGASASVARAAPLPCQVPETDRHHVFKINLDRDRAKELVDVFNFDAAATPISSFMICKTIGGQLVRVQSQTITTSPGARSSGLVDAWAGDLNRDGRVEIAARDFLTPSAGEVLTIYRQSSPFSLRFRKLQSVPGDTVKLQPHRGAPATIAVMLKANHAADGRQHLATWRWSARAGRWTCRADCGGYAAARGAPVPSIR